MKIIEVKLWSSHLKLWLLSGKKVKDFRTFRVIRWLSAFASVQWSVLDRGILHRKGMSLLIPDSPCQTSPCSITTEHYDWSKIQNLHVIQERPRELHVIAVVTE